MPKVVHIFATEPTTRIHEFHNRGISIDGYRFEYTSEPNHCDVFVAFAEGGWNGMRFGSSAPTRICITGEPSCIYRYGSGFLSQFTDIVTSQTDMYVSPWTKVHHYCQGLNSFLGVDVTDGNRLCEERATQTMENRVKDRLLSVVCSNKSHTLYHRLRSDFVKRLKADIPELDVYGSIEGGIPLKFKDDALERYRYTISIENCRVDDYWTEKLSDPILSLTQPIYCGCPNIERYFDDIPSIDISDYGSSLRRICEIVGGEAPSMDGLEARRDALGNRYMLHHIIYDVVEGRI